MKSKREKKAKRTKRRDARSLRVLFNRGQPFMLLNEKVADADVHTGPHGEIVYFREVDRDGETRLRDSAETFVDAMLAERRKHAPRPYRYIAQHGRTSSVHTNEKAARVVAGARGSVVPVWREA